METPDVKDKYSKKFEQLEELMSAQHNFKAYVQAISERQPPALPYFRTTPFMYLLTLKHFFCEILHLSSKETRVPLETIKSILN